MKNFTYLNFVFFVAISFGSYTQCTHTFTPVDYYDDSWDGASVDILVDGVVVINDYAHANGANGTTQTFSAASGSVISFDWSTGSYNSEISWSLDNGSGGSMSSGYYGASNGGYGCNTAPSVITSNNFSSSTGSFTNGAGGGSSFTAGTVSTPSSGTGPQVYSSTQGDASGSSGFYFTEATGNYNTLHTMQGTFDFSGSGADKLHFDYNMYGSNMGTLSIEVGGVQVWTLSGNQGYEWHHVMVDVSTYTSASEVVKISATTGAGFRSDICIDNVVITQGVASVPNCASNLSPADNATNISFSSPSLSWSSVSGATAYDVYFGTLAQLLGSGIPLVSNNQAGLTYTPSGLSASTAYYWKVVPTNAIGDATGCSTLTFTTEAPSPVIATSGTVSAFSSCSGTASTSDNFSVSGTYMEAGITVTAPSGFEVSTDNSTFSSSLVVGSSGTIASTTVYVRLTSSATGTNSGNVVCSSSNATSQNIAVSGTTNAVPSNVSASASAAAICSGSSIDLTSTTPASRTIYSEDFSSASTGTMAAYDANDRSAYSQIGTVNSSNCTAGKWQVANSYANGSYGSVAPNTFSGNYGLCRYVSAACTQHELLISPPLYPSGATSMTFSVDFYFAAWTSNSITDYLAIYLINETDNALVGTQMYTTTQSGTSTYTLTFDGTNASTDVYSLRCEYYGIDDDGAVVDNLLVTAIGSETYAWSSDVGGYSSSANDPTGVAPTANTTYTLSYTDYTGCSSTATTSVNVDPQPSISSQPSDGADVCIGATPSTMSVTATGGSGSYTYQWYSNTSDSNSGGSSIGSATNSTYVPDASTAGTTYYYCVVSDAQTGCNDATSNTASQVVNSAAAGSITSSVDGGSNYTSAQKTIKVGTDIYWQYSADGTNGSFSEFQYNWDNSSTYLNNFGGTSSPHSWGAGQTFGADGIIYVRAKVTCGTDEAFTSNIPTNWVYNYGGTDVNGTTSDITASLSGSPSSISNGGDMRIDQTVTWTKPSTSFETSTFRWEYEWNNDGNWVDWTSLNPNSWSDNVGANVSSGDAVLAVRTKHSGSGNAAYSNEFAVTLKKPVITTSGSLSAFASCEGSAATAQSFNVSGSDLGSDITVTAPAGFEVCATSNGTYASSITYSPTNGTLASSAVYVRLASTASGSPSGNVTCSATAATSATVAASGTASASPTITTATDLTAATNTCGETELTISHSGTGGNGQWTYSGGLVSYNNSNATDATINVSTQPSDVNTDITMTWTVGAGEVCDGAIATKTIRFNQPTSISSPDTYCYLWGGLTSTDNATGSNWYKWDATKSMWARQSAAPSASTDKLHVLTTDNNCIDASNTMTLGTTTLASLNVGSGATMSLGSGTVTLNGDLTNAGTINEGSGTVSLTAAGDQTLSGGGTTNFNNLTLNKTSDNLVLSSPATIKGTLTMNKGNINNGSNILTIGESSASPGAITHNSGSVTGKLRRYFADASSSSKYFPIGNASTTRDVTVSFGSTPGSNQFLTASYNAGYPQLSGADLYAGLPLTTADGQLIQNYDDEGYWEINPGSTATGTADSYSADINSAAYNLTIHMNGLTGANSASMDRTKVRIIKSAGPSHTSWVALTHGSISGSVDSDYTVTASGTGFSFFGAGTEDDNALPVELISFNGVCNEGVVDLVWQTASEQNSEDFEVAYSRDGVDWKTIHTEPAAGFSNTLITYDYTHEGAVSGNNYYRLTQNDIDGASVVYDNLILNANCQTTSEGYFSVFPNPSSGTFQVIMNNESLKGAANINMVDTKGNIVFTKPIEVNSGINMYVIQKQLSPGIYYIHIENGTMRTTVVKHSIR